MKICFNLLLTLIVPITLTKFYIKLYAHDEYMTSVQEKLMTVIMGSKKNAILFQLLQGDGGLMIQTVEKKPNVLDIAQNKTDLVLFPQHGEANQVFTLVDTHIDRTVNLIKNQGKCIKVDESKRITKTECDQNDPNQLFEFEYLTDEKSVENGEKVIGDIENIINEAENDNCGIDDMIAEFDIGGCKSKTLKTECCHK